MPADSCGCLKCTKASLKEWLKSVYFQLEDIDFQPISKEDHATQKTMLLMEEENILKELARLERPAPKEGRSQHKENTNNKKED